MAGMLMSTVYTQLFCTEDLSMDWTFILLIVAHIFVLYRIANYFEICIHNIYVRVCLWE